jgi:hypothetical protein
MLTKKRKKKAKQGPNYRVKVRVPRKAADDGATIAVSVDQLNLDTDKIKIKLPKETKHGDLLRAKVNGQEIFIEVLLDDIFKN